MSAADQAGAATPRVSARDRDGDGLLDRDEQRIAREYLPFLSLHPRDRCPLAAMVYRLRRHPRDPRLLHLTVSVLFQRDCGALSHLGDNEAFGVTIDPRRPAPHGITAVRAIAHQSSLCEHVSECGQCGGLPRCKLARSGGRRRPVIYFSRDKHGGYVDARRCAGACFFTNWCALSARPLSAPLINVGEPGAPLVRDLSAAGGIVAALGWRERRLFGYDPWSRRKFGGAGRVGEDLVDAAFLTPACVAKARDVGRGRAGRAPGAARR